MTRRRARRTESAPARLNESSRRQWATGSDRDNPSWLQPGRPLLLADYTSKEAERPPETKVVDLRQDIGVRLAHCRASFRGTLVGVWRTIVHLLSTNRALDVARIDKATYGGAARLHSDAAAGRGSQPVYITDRIVVAGRGGTVNEFRTRAGGDIHGVIGSGNIVTSSFS
ncbi:hypothetical protein [Streptomyces sp. NPDC002082]|uniref:hypothetical protein n=1 Tax=Streptomyces sp. NPDC002082 TaxID=3154772 RepID=UPI00332DCD6D